METNNGTALISPVGTAKRTAGKQITGRLWETNNGTALISPLGAAKRTAEHFIDPFGRAAVSPSAA
jgi:hypothetical protein